MRCASTVADGRVVLGATDVVVVDVVEVLEVVEVLVVVVVGVARPACAICTATKWAMWIEPGRDTIELLAAVAFMHRQWFHW